MSATSLLVLLLNGEEVNSMLLDLFQQFISAILGLIGGGVA
ncbi:hypothetical protein [Gordonia sp. OPL2]|nr:hypothetical protein [Gordonia sp. OPL2]